MSDKLIEEQIEEAVNLIQKITEIAEVTGMLPAKNSVEGDDCNCPLCTVRRELMGPNPDMVREVREEHAAEKAAAELDQRVKEAVAKMKERKKKDKDGKIIFEDENMKLMQFSSFEEVQDYISKLSEQGVKAREGFKLTPVKVVSSLTLDDGSVLQVAQSSDGKAVIKINEEAVIFTNKQLFDFVNALMQASGNNTIN